MIKKIILMGAMTTALTACAVVQNEQLQSGAKDAQQMIAQKCPLFLNLSEQEASAWLNAPMEQCTGGHTQPWDRGETLAIGECGTNLIKQYMRPVAPSKSRFDAMINEREKEYQDYANGSISWTEFTARGEKRVADYVTNSNNGSYFAYSQCHNAIMQEKVYPVYPDALKPVLTEYLSNFSAFSRQADKSNMEQEDYMIGTQQLWAQFTSKEQQRIGTVNAQNQRAWQNFSQQLQQLDQQQATQCDAIDIAPMASIGCKYVCINGTWSEVCG